VTRDTFNYRKLTDKSESEAQAALSKSEDDSERLEQLSSGNHHLLPIFGSSESLKSEKMEVEGDDGKVSKSG
jgi:poly-D-alanine transfer protein DltD